MREKLLALLACPACGGDLTLTADETAPDGDVIAGRLECAGCGRTDPIVAGIPRFVAPENYAESFGLQWNTFHAEQLDSVNGFDQSARRFARETDWPAGWLAGKWILDAGCGAGRFLDVVSQHDCDVVGFDLSNAVDAARRTLAGRPNVHLVQASVYELPFKPGAFDGCYCIGVVQHTPDPQRVLRTLPALVRPGGRLAVTIYERRRWTHLYSKYLLRRVTTKMSGPRLLTAIRAAMPVLFPLTEVTFRLPGLLGRVFRFLIPVSNYVGANTYTNAGLSLRERYRWAVMDTFDMLAPAYDQPQRYEDVVRTLQSTGVRDLRRTDPAAGVALTGVVATDGAR
jgi:SAM-dependent methyltransferase